MKEDSFIEKVYFRLKGIFFECVEKNNWIWKDYFSDRTNGYAYFKETYLSDIDNISKIYKETNMIEENIDDVSGYIESKLKSSDFYNIIFQSAF